MTKIKYDSAIMKYISLFESLSGAKVKDCIVNDNIMFIIEEGEMGKAIGKKGSNIHKISDILKKKIRLVEFNKNLIPFVGNLIYPIKSKEIKEEEGIITVFCNDTKSRGILIGREKQNLYFITGIVKRYFKVTEIKVA